MHSSVRISRKLSFPTLSAAIAYAECHGLDYRIIVQPERAESTGARSLPRSWRARLQHNGRGGEIYRA